MARRFSRIRQSPRLEIAYTAYKQWQDRVDPYTPRAAGSRPGGFEEVAIIPFGIDTTEKAIVTASRRANAYMGGGMGTRIAAVTATMEELVGLVPAKITLFAGTGTDTVTRSDITNLEYQRRNGASYTHPFGGNTATEREIEAFRALATNFRAANANNGVSYQPERFRFN